MNRITFLEITTPDSQNRLAVFVGGQVVCRAPSIKPETARHTAPGSVVWVLSENSKALGRLERQLREGARVLRPFDGEGDLERVEASVLSGVSYLTPEDLAGLVEERAGAGEAIAQRRAERQAAKSDAKQGKKTTYRDLQKEAKLLGVLANGDHETLEARVNEARAKLVKPEKEVAPQVTAEAMAALQRRIDELTAERDARATA
jgi:hypothetical protein